MIEIPIKTILKFERLAGHLSRAKRVSFEIVAALERRRARGVTRANDLADREKFK